MNIHEFDYDLPDKLIAVRPPAKRGDSRLLVLDKQTGKLNDSKYAQLADFLQPGDLLVLNNTKVIKARLIAKTEDGSDRELLLLEKHGEYQDTHHMKVMYRRKLVPDMKLDLNGHTLIVKTVSNDGTAIINSKTDLLELADSFGNVPLPPYMRRTANKTDVYRYQTVFAKNSGSVAAPTASLNMTDTLMDKIHRKKVNTAELTLHVGLGTFMPIRTDNIIEHIMHKEYFHIPQDTIEAIQQTKENGHRVIAVGTTVTRTLEYCAKKLLNANNDLMGEADIFIYPGFQFHVVDALITNFHAPKSTVLMMAAAFAGWDHLKSAYKHAKNDNYAFLSYGDSMFIQ